jgi:hypothetical protein
MTASSLGKPPFLIILKFFLASAILLFFLERERTSNVGKDDLSIPNEENITSPLHAASGSIKISRTQKWCKVCLSYFESI